MTNQDEKLNEEIYPWINKNDIQAITLGKSILKNLLNKARQQGAEAERKRIIEIIKSVIYKKFEESGFYKYYSDEVIKSILSHLKNSEAIEK
jgi:hypothetical protein